MRAEKRGIAQRLLVAIALLAWAGGLTGQQPQGSADADSQLHAADALIQQGKSDQALDLLQGLAARRPDLSGLAARLGKLYYQKRDYERAIAQLNKAVAERPSDGESVQLLGLSYYLMGHIQDAIPLLERVSTVLPRPDVSGSYILGLCYLETGDLEKARTAFAKTFRVPPDSAAGHLVLAKMMMRQEFEEKAVGELQRALELDSRLPMTHFILGEVYLFKSNVPGAIEEFRKELALDPLAWYAYEGLGNAYVRVENWDEAENSLKQANWINPDFSGPYILLGKVELKKGDASLAAGFLERALKMDPNNFTAHYMLGTAYKQLGRTAEANREFELTKKLHGEKDQP